MRYFLKTYWSIINKDAKLDVWINEMYRHQDLQDYQFAAKCCEGAIFTLKKLAVTYNKKLLSSDNSFQIYSEYPHEKDHRGVLQIKGRGHAKWVTVDKKSCLNVMENIGRFIVELMNYKTALLNNDLNSLHTDN